MRLFLLLSLLLVGGCATSNDPRKMQSDSHLHERCRQEVTELHQFFEDWFLGRLEQTPSEFARFSDAMAEGFHLVSPDGDMRPLAKLLEDLWQAHRVYVNTDFRIWVENIEVRRILPDTILVSYEEWQEVKDEKKGRISSAWLQPAEDAPEGLRWMHVHETWLP